MKNKRFTAKILIDIGMTICLLLLMPYSLLSETAQLYDDRRDALRRKGAVALKFLLIEKLERQGGRQDR